MVFLAIVTTLLLTTSFFKTRSMHKTVKSVTEKLVVSAFLLFITNIVGNQFGLQVSINEYTLMITSILGFPGLLAIAVIQNVII